MLFSNENNPLVFKVTNLKDKYSLQSLIASNGGITRDSGSVDFVLVDPDLSNNPEAVNSVFVTDCIKSNSLLDVDAYRLKNLSSWHSSSNTKNSYSPNDDKIMIDHYVQNGARNSLKVWDLLGNGHSGNSWYTLINQGKTTLINQMSPLSLLNSILL